MAQPKTLTFGTFLIEIEDPATPGTFVAPCGFTDRSLEIKAETATTAVPDCDVPDAAVWNATGIKTLSASVSGQGVLSLLGLQKWREWMFSAADRNVRVHVNQAAANGGGYYQGAAVLTSLKHDATFGEKVKLSVQIESDGQWAWTAATT